MIKFALTAALVIGSLAVATPSIALADQQEDFEQNCIAQGGTLTGDTCKYPNGRVETCTFEADISGCYSYGGDEDDDGTDDVPVVHKLTGVFVNVPVKVVKQPVPHGPMTLAKTSPTKVKVQSSMKSVHLAKPAAVQSVKVVKTVRLR